MRLTSKSTRARLPGGLLAALLMASCGGSTEPVERFVPSRVIALGDESSVLNTDGSKYTINATVSDTDLTLDCTRNPIWVQMLANVYSFVFAQCNPSGAAVTAVTYAVAGAKVADIAAQVNQVGVLNGSQLVTLMVGANDILAQYARYPAVSEAQLSAELEGAGLVVANHVNALADAGGKVLIATVPDMGLTPFALAEKAANTDTDRAAMLTRMSARFNAKLRASIYNDGRRIGLVLMDELMQTVAKFPLNYGYISATTAACLSTAVLPSCTTATLQPAVGDIPAAGSYTWLWADATRLSPGGHGQLGGLAATRATGNPF